MNRKESPNISSILHLYLEILNLQSLKKSFEQQTPSLNNFTTDLYVNLDDQQMMNEDIQFHFPDINQKPPNATVK